MKELSQKYLDWYQEQDKIVRALFCLLWDIPSNLERLAKSVLAQSVLGIVLSIVLMIFGGWVLFVVDLISILIKDKVYWLDDLNFNNECHCNHCDCADCKNNPVDDQTDNDGVDGTVE